MINPNLVVGFEKIARFKLFSATFCSKKIRLNWSNFRKFKKSVRILTYDKLRVMN